MGSLVFFFYTSQRQVFKVGKYRFTIQLQRTRVFLNRIVINNTVSFQYWKKKKTMKVSNYNNHLIQPKMSSFQDIRFLRSIHRLLAPYPFQFNLKKLYDINTYFRGRHNLKLLLFKDNLGESVINAYSVITIYLPRFESIFS